MGGHEQRFRNKITILSFVCSLLVIWIHTNNLVQYGISEESRGISQIIFCIEEFWGTIANTVAVPVFFVISGYLFFRTFQLSKVLDKYKKRLFSVALPYFFWCSFYYLFFVIVTNVPIIAKYINADRYDISLLAYLSALWTNEYYTLWFLKDLIVFIILSPLFYFLLRDYKRIKIGLLVLVIIFASQYVDVLKLPSPAIIYYLFGAYFGINQKQLAEKEYSDIAKVIGLIVIVGSIVTRFSLGGVVGVITFIVAIWVTLDLVTNEKNLPWWMKITFFVYVSHDLILEIFEKNLLIFSKGTFAFALIDYLLMPFIVYFVIAMIAKVLMKIPLLWKIVSGNRTVDIKLKGFAA